mgnify:CR=1 FL=1
MKPLRVVAAVIFRNGRVLAAQRRDDRQEGGLWEFPGGKVEQAETDADALTREILEELGVHATIRECIGTNRFRYDHGIIDLVAYRVDITGTPNQHDHQRLAWLDQSELGNTRWAPADIPFVEQIMRENWDAPR